MSADKPYRPELKGMPRLAFGRANPERYGKVQRQPEAIASLRNLDARALAIKNRMRRHFARHQETWVAREAIKVWQQRSALRAKHPAPLNYFSRKLATDSIMKEARRRVRVRMAKRLSSVNVTKTRMENAVVRTQKFAERDRALSLSRTFPKSATPTRKQGRKMS